jgi:hypothetical protein
MEKEQRKNLIALAHHHTLRLLCDYNNKPDYDHIQAIERIIEGFVNLLENKNQKLAFPLFCGGGKTTCIRGFLKALHELNLYYSVVVSATQVEALCELKKALISDDKIPIVKIGLIHSKQYHSDKKGEVGYASLPSNTEEEVQSMPVVLVTHNKIKHQNTCLDSYYYYHGEKRDLIIWDESLLSGEAITLTVLKICNSIDNAINGFKFKIIGKSHEEQYSSLIEYLNELKSILRNHKENHNDTEICFPKLPLLKYQIESQLDNLLVDDEGKDLKSLFECIENERELRYIKIDNGAIINFRQTIPEELDTIAILDASHPLRELTQSDSSIATVELDCPKSYENLTINYFKSSAGRYSLEKEFFYQKDSKLVAEIVEIINSILTKTPDEPIIIWNYKAKGSKSIAEAIKRKLRELNSTIDFEAINERGDKIFNFNTFGNELGLNSLTHCKHSIFCGLLFLPRAYLVGMLKGLSKNMNRDVFEKKLIDNTALSEQAHIFYQAVSRGSSRLTENGRCKNHNVYFFHPKPLALKSMLNEVFPQATWRRYKAVHIDNVNGFYYELAERINQQLLSLKESDYFRLNPRTKMLNRIATQTLKKEYFPDLERHQWSNAIRVFKDEFPWDCEIKGQSFIVYS